jgi:hypothetical protein
VSAETDASNSEAAADSEEAAAEAEARAEPMMEEAAEAMADGAVPEKLDSFGAVGRALAGAPPPALLSELHETSSEPHAHVARRAAMRRDRRERTWSSGIRVLMRARPLPGVPVTLMLRAGRGVREPH